jgi:hypothetical protein
MLDFLFQLGQFVSLLGLASGLLLTVWCRNWIDGANTAQAPMTDINLLPSLGNELPVSLAESDAEPGRRDTVAA